MYRRTDPTDWMWAEACALMERAERLHRGFFRLAAPAQATTWEPPADVFESEHEIVVVVALPGVAPDDVEVVAEPGALRVRARRPSPLIGRAHVRQLEIPYGSFERRIPLPDVPVAVGRPELSHGCLILRLAKA